MILTDSPFRLLLLICRRSDFHAGYDFSWYFPFFSLIIVFRISPIFRHAIAAATPRIADAASCAITVFSFSDALIRRLFIAATPSQPLLISIRYAFASCAAFSLALFSRAAMPRRRHFCCFRLTAAAFRDYFAIERQPIFTDIAAADRYYCHYAIDTS
jgi:hypothetical protein